MFHLVVAPGLELEQFAMSDAEELFAAADAALYAAKRAGRDRTEVAG